MIETTKKKAKKNVAFRVPLPLFLDFETICHREGEKLQGALQRFVEETVSSGRVLRVGTPQHGVGVAGTVEASAPDKALVVSAAEKLYVQALLGAMRENREDWKTIKSQIDAYRKKHAGGDKRYEEGASTGSQHQRSKRKA